MKSLVILAACALVAVAQHVHIGDVKHDDIQDKAELINEDRSLILDLLIRQLFDTIRHVIKNGSWLLGIPVLDPFIVDHYRLVLPAGLLNLDLNITNGVLEGIGDFVVHRSDFDRNDISFEVEISLPLTKIKADNYKLEGDFYTAIPLYGDGEAFFEVEEFKFRGVLYLKQSEDGKSALIDHIGEPNFSIGSIKSQITNVIGGGDIDGIVNSIIEEVVVSYCNRFSKAIALLNADGIVDFVNPYLDQLDSWKYVQLFL
ncbi:hypothetical protein EVAR_15721_1 [Eumeta japonica]|uniref:Circadian clock-controlled protein n=1 Tax=Eumeta variegata TaxID=151549 RepID=A0A4C1UAW3_EUMVA|nr:hypothetical protein EVAR_15721_1 [Eumeta japonica]